ncbi:hypothetical protein [Actinotignum schaalii]|nr:hypothetical protein [Actinotignum schaalii]
MSALYSVLIVSRGNIVGVMIAMKNRLACRAGIVNCPVEDL